MPAVSCNMAGMTFLDKQPFVLASKGPSGGGSFAIPWPGHFCEVISGSGHRELCSSGGGHGEIPAALQCRVIHPGLHKLQMWWEPTAPMPLPPLFLFLPRKLQLLKRQETETRLIEGGLKGLFHSSRAKWQVALCSCGTTTDCGVPLCPRHSCGASSKGGVPLWHRHCCESSTRHSYGSSSKGVSSCTGCGGILEMFGGACYLLVCDEGS